MAEKGIMVKRSSSPNISGNRNRERYKVFSDVHSDIVVDVDGVSFALHKFPLASRSGRIEKLVVDYKGPDPFKLVLDNIPGGAQTFELAAKFCYGINFDINTSNVAILRCAAEYLEMTEEHGDENLIACTESFLKELVLQSPGKSAKVLRTCQDFLPLAEDVKIVSRCVDGIASNICKDQIASKLSNHANSGIFSNINVQHSTVECWADDLTALRIDLFQQVLMAMKSQGLRTAGIVRILMQYAQQSLKALNKRPEELESKEPSSNPVFEHGQRVIVETIVSFLPDERNIVPTAFLFALLRTAIILDTTVACRLDLEKRIGIQLEQATLDELLIPSLSHAGDALFDVDVVHRVLVNFLQEHEVDDLLDAPKPLHELDGENSSSQAALFKVARLIDMYLAEIAPDANLKVPKFIGLAELIPDHARLVDDGLYRAMDIYFKAHPTISDFEKKKVCKLMNIQKLSQEACAHAAQNERLPVQIMVQVLYFEQLRLRTEVSNSKPGVDSPPLLYTSQRMASATASAAMSPRDNYAALRRENQDLRSEVTRMRMRLNDLEKEHVNMKGAMNKPSSTNKFLSTVSKTISRLIPFAKHSSKEASQVKKPKSRRYSIS